MKNIFKILSIALIGSAVMFAACSKDEEDNKDNNGGGNNNTPTAKIKIGTPNANNMVEMMDADSSIYGAFSRGYCTGSDQITYKYGTFRKSNDTTYYYLEAAIGLENDGKTPIFPFFYANFWTANNKFGPKSALYYEKINDSTATEWYAYDIERSDTVIYADPEKGTMHTWYQFAMKNSADTNLKASFFLSVGGKFEFTKKEQ